MNAAQFKAWRKEMGLSQTQAADELGWGITTLRKYEQDEITDFPHIVGMAMLGYAVKIAARYIT